MNIDTSANATEGASLDVGKLYRQYKAYAFSIAYRMLGSVVEAEDVVQDCFAALQAQEQQQREVDEPIHNPKSYIAKLIVNRSLNLLASARNQRESYVGEWLPEPMTDPGLMPEETMAQKEMISYAYLVMLERLSPVERAVFVLREAFGHEYRDIAEWLGKSESNCRQIFSRAKRNLPSSVPSKEYGEAELAAKQKLLSRFTAAFMNYDVGAMMELLAEQPVFTSDGGGKVHTVMRTMNVRKGVVALLTSRRVLNGLRQMQWMVVRINGEPQAALFVEGKLRGVLCLQADASGERLEGCYLIVNPDKLRSIKITQENIDLQE
ncbi:sigma-70 family RNA polymerase sigma factor [Paenibacillus sp. FSL W8-0426]|uniref:sigma-70 family RNA polymerase sigma factor n=1 Tax=Paenibacillus sp. FSL W8-0426 TaxID=2921714 RepID=UPI0030D8C6DC